MEAGHKAQNVYLYCASEGLGAVTRTLIDKEAFSKAIGLNQKHVVISAQTVGYPSK
ncbi:MAG: nitroreductase family protein [Candidatus Bathyarchaeia archaeon]